MILGRGSIVSAFASAFGLALTGPHSQELLEPWRAALALPTRGGASVARAAAAKV